jgi:hypothetical protein
VGTKNVFAWKIKLFAATKNTSLKPKPESRSTTKLLAGLKKLFEGLKKVFNGMIPSSTGMKKH